MATENIKAGQHVVDRIVLKVLDENSCDLLGATDHSVIARIAAKQVRDGIALRARRGQSIAGHLAAIHRMSDSDLRDLCLERVTLCVH